MSNEERKVIALTGPSAAGKTTLGHYLSHHFNHEFVHIRLDDYLKNPKHFPLNERGHKDWDHPDNFHWQDLMDHLSKLKKGESADWRTFAKSYDEKVYHYTLEPKRYIFLEGTMVLTNPDVVSMSEIKIYLDVPLEVSLARRAERGKREWGLDLVEYDKEVMVPVIEKHRRVQKFMTDYIVDGTQDPRMVADEVRSIIYKALGEQRPGSTYISEWKPAGTAA